MHALKIIDTFTAFGGASGSRTRHDDVTASAFVENELKQVVPQMYDKLFPELDARDHIPLSLDIASAATAWSYDSMNKRGKAQFMGANATDMPRADVSKKRLTFPIRTIVLAYGWTMEEIEGARFAGMQLDRHKAEAARRGIAELEHEVLLFGDAQRNLPGFLTNPATPRLAVPNGSWLTTATPDDILEDMNFVVDEIWVLSERVHRPNTILLPLRWFRLVMTRRIGPGASSSTTTIAEFFLRTNGFVRELMSLPELEEVGPGDTPTMLAYQKDPGILSGVVPLGFQTMEAQVKGMEVIVPNRERLGGSVWFYPFAGTFGDGI